ncbi:hypothetical protein GCM10022280_05230 [Sphingomonas swuensis]|uniref:Uncharacterized protein n=1 Tax=Sphingomonas swuensis TaxID=977800 RepID=A0ABP7SEU5_9SPHN
MKSAGKRTRHDWRRGGKGAEATAPANRAATHQQGDHRIESCPGIANGAEALQDRSKLVRAKRGRLGPIVAQLRQLAVTLHHVAPWLRH